MEGKDVRFTSTSRLPAVTLATVIGFATAGYAQDAPADGQKVEPPPVPDRGTTSQLNCIGENTQYTKTGKNSFYVMTFENKCEVRMKCAVFAYVLNAKGPAHGRSTLILGAKSEGPAATKSYALKVKGIGGLAAPPR